MARPALSRRVAGASGSATLAMKAEADRLRAEGISVVDLGLGEPDFDTPEHIKEAARTALLENRTHYTSVAGIPDLRRALAARYARVYGAAYDESEILVGSGAKGILYALCQTLVDAGDEVAIFAPFWVSYPEQVKLAGGIPVLVPTIEAEGFIPTAAALEGRIGPKTRAIIVNSPCNPTGAVIPKKEWDGIADLAIANDLYVISDEVYEAYVYDGGSFVSGASCLPRLKERLILVSAVSKSYAMTGWRLGYAAGHRDVIRATATLQSHDASQAATLSQYAALAALNGTQEPLARMLEEYARRRAVLIPALRSIPGISCGTPLGAFYAFPNVTGLYARLGVSSSGELASKLLKEVHVVTVPGEGFGMPGYLRISYAAPLASIREGIRRIAALVAGGD